MRSGSRLFGFFTPGGRLTHSGGAGPRGSCSYAAPAFDAPSPRRCLTMTQRLQDSLLALDPTGPSGFEGVVRDALAEITGQTFGLLKSGPQGGLDGITSAIANRLVIGFEGKRYKESNRLAADELVAKLYDTAQNYPSLDLWILATTRSISPGDGAKIEAVGANLGIDVLILDWPGGASTAPIADLIAAAPASAAYHFSSDPMLLTELDTARQSAGFEVRLRALLERLTQADVGLAAARDRCSAYLLGRMSDRETARLTFNSHAALAANDVKRVNRDNLNAAMEGWWHDNASSPLVLLGREGVGKTWEALGWWLTKSALDPEFALTLVLPARDVAGIDGPDHLARLIQRATGIRDGAFWRRRLDRWAKIETDRPLMLLVIDGLNQNWMYGDWADLILSLSTPEWRDKIAIVLTCRPDHWKNRLAELPGLPRRAIQVEVDNFSEDELSALLGLYDLKRSDFDEPMLALLRVPRLCHIAIERRRDLQQSGDITPERLVYEDWRHRRPQAQQTLSHEEFKRFVTELGRAAEGNLDGMELSRADLLERMSSGDGRAPGDFEHVLSELIDGDWLVPASGSHKFTLSPQRAPAALGLTLVADLRGTAERAEIEQRMALLLDPLQGMDISVKILRHAATFALLDPSLERHVVAALVEAWLGEQNCSEEDFQRFWRMIGCDTELILDIAERLWFDRDGEGRIDEYIDKGFCNAFKWPEVSKPLIERLVCWFSTYWLDPVRAEFGHQVPDDDEASDRRNQTASRARLADEEGLASRYGFTFVEVDPGNQIWGCARAVELLSWVPRGDLLDVYTAWAITRAIMGRSYPERTMEWNLRWFHDMEHGGDAETAPSLIIARAQELIAGGGEIGRKAGHILLAALATPQAYDLLAVGPGDEAAPAGLRGSDEPSNSAAEPIAWPKAPSTPNFDGQPLNAVRLLNADPLDPECELSPAMIRRLRAAADAITDEQINSGLRGADGGFQDARPHLARWAPDKLAELLNRRYRPPHPASASKRGLFQRLAAFFFPSAAQGEPPLPSADGIETEMLALDEATHDGWTRLADQPSMLADRQAAYIIPLLGASATAQIEMLGDMSTDGKLQNWSGIFLQPPGEANWELLGKHLDPTNELSELRFWLLYLTRVNELALPPGWTPLEALISHVDPSVRAETFRLIYRAKDPMLADAIIASGWTASEAADRNEIAYGSLALLWSSTASTGGALPLIHRDALGEFSHTHSGCNIYIDAFADHVRDELHLLLTSKSRVYPHSLLAVHEGWDELIARHEAAFKTWVEPFLKLGTSESFHLFAFLEQFPLLGALEAYEKLVPGSHAKLIEKSLDPLNFGAMRVGELYKQAAELKGPESEHVRKLALNETNNDQKLFDFAFTVQRSGETVWLIDLIERDLEAPTAWLIARAITLAGFLAPDEAAETLWAAKLANPPTKGWLEKVWFMARRHYERGRRNRVWRNRYLEASSNIEAFAAFELFARTADRRLIVDKESWVTSLRDVPLRRSLHWDINGPTLNSAFDKFGKEREKTFLLSEPPLSGQAPRMR